MSISELLSRKDEQFRELNEQFLAYQQQTKLIIDELESQNSKLRQKNQQLQNQLHIIKEKKLQQIKILDRQLEMYRNDNKIYSQKNDQFQREIIQLQNNNEGLQNQLRAVNALLEQYESKVEKTMEQLACLRCELQQSKQTNQQQITRLKSQIQQTQQQLNIVKTKHQKHQDESQLRMSQFSWSSLSKDRKWKDSLNLTTYHQRPFGFMKKNHIQQKINKQNGGFQHTIELMNSLLIQIDKKCLKKKYNTKNGGY